MMAIVIMWLLSMGLFTAVVWGPAVVVPWPFPGSDEWLVLPQIKLLLEMFPTLAGYQWLILLAGYLKATDLPRLFLGLVYAATGGFLGQVVYQFNNGWLARIMWLGLAFSGWLIGLSLVGLVMSAAKFLQ
ncbi:MAG: hypothetical protein HYZ73_02720 [Elusimicrobia bacterium]|nr:hypothetical protein [Elusimicrobiota bacterium]